MLTTSGSHEQHLLSVEFSINGCVSHSFQLPSSEGRRRTERRKVRGALHVLYYLQWSRWGFHVMWMRQFLNPFPIHALRHCTQATLLDCAVRREAAHVDCSVGSHKDTDGRRYCTVSYRNWQPTRTACHPLGYVNMINALPPPLTSFHCDTVR